MTGWTSTHIDINSLQSVGVAAECDVETDAPKNEFKGLRVIATIAGADAPAGAPRVMPRRRYEVLCPYGYLSTALCAICLKLGWDFRYWFCEFSGEMNIDTETFEGI